MPKSQYNKNLEKSGLKIKT